MEVQGARSRIQGQLRPTGLDSRATIVTVARRRCAAAYLCRHPDVVHGPRLREDLEAVQAPVGWECAESPAEAQEELWVFAVWSLVALRAEPADWAPDIAV